MEKIIVGEKQFQLKFKGKVSPQEYFLMLKELESHKPYFSSALFEIFSLAIEREEEIKNRILDLFRKKPKNADETRSRILRAKEILGFF